MLFNEKNRKIFKALIEYGGKNILLKDISDMLIIKIKNMGI